MNDSYSLRLRLIALILLPLALVSAVFGAWAYFDAEETAAERFDRSLLSTALAISRDTAATGGDALSEETRDLLRDTSGGAVFYHVYAPDGVFVTGYATPPVSPVQQTEEGVQTYYDAIYQGATVRALRFTQTLSIDGLSGPFTFTVWQQTDVRDGFVRGRTGPVFIVIAAMIGALGVIVWFGVSLGLAPLRQLEDAIERRSAGDLSPIRRSIPVEVRGIVGRLNALLGELSETMKAKDAFISDAAHQLRNPIAGVLSLAEAIPKAKSVEAAQARSEDLLEAARSVARLTDDLLTLERAKAGGDASSRVRFGAGDVLEKLSDRFGSQAKSAGVHFETDLSQSPTELYGDPVMFEQAVLNLLDNCLSHGGADLSMIRLSSEVVGGKLEVMVADDGIGIAPEDFSRSLARFSQIGPSAGSGLGLPICATVAHSFGGEIRLSNRDGAFAVRISLPLGAMSPVTV